MKLSIFTDEISPDPVRALELAARWRVPFVEVRGLPGGRFPRPQDPELREFQQRAKDAGLGISGVSPGFSKGPVDDPEVEHILTAGLPRACEWARELGTNLISCFGFQRSSNAPMPAAVTERLAQMAEVAAGYQCRLVLENEAVCWGATGLEAAGIARAVNADNFALLWDPGNSAKAGSDCPFPDEYTQLRDLVDHVHLKNYAPESGDWSLMESGLVDWPGQFRALAREQYSGFLVIETHMRELPEGVEAAPGLSAQETNSWRNREFVSAHLGL